MEKDRGDTFLANLCLERGFEGLKTEKESLGAEGVLRGFGFL